MLSLCIAILGTSALMLFAAAAFCMNARKPKCWEQQGRDEKGRFTKRVV